MLVVPVPSWPPWIAPTRCLPAARTGFSRPSRSRTDLSPPRLAFKPEVIATGWIDPGDMSEVTSVVLNLTDTPDASQGPALTGAKRVALDALREACAAAGGPVHVDVWREEAYKRGISASSNQGAKQRAFHRAVEELGELALVNASGDSWAPTSIPRQTRHNPDTTLLSGVHQTRQTRHTPLGVSGCLGGLSGQGDDHENPFQEVGRG